MIGMQREDAVHGARQDRIDSVGLGRHREAHMQEVGRIGQVVARINEGLADRVLVGHGRNGRHLGDQPQRSGFALDRIGDVDGVVIEGRQGTDHAGHDRHRVGVATEAAEEVVHLLVHHGVARHTVLEQIEFLGRRQLAVQQQIADFEVMALVRQLFDRIAAIEQLTLVAVDIGDGAVAGCGRGEAGIVGEQTGFRIKTANVDN